MHLTHVDLQTIEPQSAAAEERLGQSSSSPGPAQMPPVPLSTVVDIGPNDDPQQMPQLTPLISDSVARLVGWPFQPPTGNPARITKHEYLALIKRYPGETYYLTTYATYNTIALNAYEVVPVLAAFWKASGDAKYLDALDKAVNNFAAAIMAETTAQASSGEPPLLSTYRCSEYAWVYLGLRVLTGTPQGDALLQTFAASLAHRAEVWPLSPFQGVDNNALAAALWYDLALHYGTTPPTNAPALQAYVDSIWQETSAFHDTFEDDSWYSNWPVRLDRSVVFANQRFTVVRDRIVFMAQADALLGQNWTFGEMSLPGTHWVNVWTPRKLNGWFGQTVGQNNLATVSTPGLAQTIDMVADTSDYTAVRVLDLREDAVRLVLINTSGGTVHVGRLATDAEAIILTYQHGQAVHCSGWHATQIIYAGHTMTSTNAATDIDMAWRLPFDVQDELGLPWV